mmetsp:Transcript_2211/g.6982  ORF Transcript_2211/g.6982 Transcript_2211/m.6982 type:complete len:227 (+) Transcript_2211:1141-1821(+)|eukprot:scaffold89507_cov27-Tisochrysis_lutea.AAC.2
MRLAQLCSDGMRQRRESLAVGARVTILELDPAGVGRVGLALLGELNLPCQASVEYGSKLIPVDSVRVVLNPRDLGKRGLHAQRRRVARIDTGDEGIDATEENLLAQYPRHPFADRLLLALRRRRVAEEGPDPRTDLAWPRKEIAEQSKLEHTIGAKYELELSCGSLAPLTLGERVKLAVMVDPRRKALIGKHKLILDAQLMRDAHDGRLRGERVGTLLPDETVLLA